MVDDVNGEVAQRLMTDVAVRDKSVRFLPLIVLSFLYIILHMGTVAGLAAETLRGYEIVAENDNLVLYLNRDTTEITIKRKDSGTIWYSNPPGADKKTAGSQLSITYYTPSDVQMTMDNYRESIVYGQFEISEIDNGVRIVYTLGKEWDDSAFLPVMISKERFEELILNKLDRNSDRKLFLGNYTCVSLEADRDDYPAVDVFQVNSAELFGQYTLVCHTEGYKPTERDQKKLIELLVDQVWGHRSDLKGREQVRHDDISQLVGTPTYVLNAKIAAWDAEDMVSLLKSIGYTPEDVTVDHEANNLDSPLRNIQVFRIPVEYTLADDGFVASIPASEIEFPDGVLDERGKRVTYPLSTVKLLEFFCAAGADQDGYMLVPDGSGALINFNNGKTFAEPYRQRVYGVDYANTRQTSQVSGTAGTIPGYSGYRVESIRMPVFGMRRNDKGFLAVVEDGDAHAIINADIAGRILPYNRVYAEFEVRPYSEVSIDNPSVAHRIVWKLDPKSSVNVYQTVPYQGRASVRYILLEAEESDYVAMARRYREYLMERLGMRTLAPGDDIPFYIELVGAIEKRQPVLGAPRQVIQPLTTYRQAEQVLSDLMDQGISQIRLRLSGWLKGGLRHVFPRGVSLEGSLGSRADFAALVRFAKENGVALYPDVSFPIVFRDTIFDGFSARTGASRRLSRATATTTPIESAEDAYVLSPRRLGSLLEDFMDDFVRYETPGISLRYVGGWLSSDFDRQRQVDRQEASAVVAGALKSVRERDGLRVLVDTGNQYALPYATDVVDAPLRASGFIVADREVPFYQIALHGLVSYAGEPINLAQDKVRTMLKTIETGAAPYYKGYFADASTVKNTDYNYLYNGHYTDFLDEAVEFYRLANAALRSVQSLSIVNHEKLSDGVFRTTYENGTAVIVNYNDVEQVIGDTVVAAKGFRLVEGGTTK